MKVLWNSAVLFGFNRTILIFSLKAITADMGLGLAQGRNVAAESGELPCCCSSLWAPCGTGTARLQGKQSDPKLSSNSSSHGMSGP